MTTCVVRWIALGTLAAFGALLIGTPALALKPQDEKSDVNDLALEVNALQSLYTLKLEESQLKKLQEWAKETAQKTNKREPAKASKEYREKLEQLRAALAAAEDDDKIGDLTEDLDDLREAEKPMIDDGVDLTAAARKRTPAFLKLLKVQQVKAQLDTLNDELGDPLDRVLFELDGIRGLTGNDWKQRRDEIVDFAVRLTSGVDEKKADKLTDELTVILSRVHGYSEAEFKAKRGDVEKQIHDLLGDVGPLDVMRSVVERSLAELLSNPRLPAALAARLKEGK